MANLVSVQLLESPAGIWSLSTIWLTRISRDMSSRMNKPFSWISWAATARRWLPITWTNKPLTPSTIIEKTKELTKTSTNVKPRSLDMIISS